MNLLITNGILIDDRGSRPGELLIEGSSISAVGDTIDREGLPRGTRIIDAGGRYVTPGLIDAHTHYHLVSRGTVTADSFPEGSRLAAFGGVTTVIDFADHDKSAVLEVSTRRRISAMEEGMSIDFALHQGVYGMHEGIRGELEAVRAAGVRTVKIFTTYKEVGYLIEMDGLRELFKACRDLELMVSVHAEDNDLIEQLLEEHGQNPFPPSAHAELRPAEAEARAIRYVGELAGSLGMPVYIVHLSSKAGLAMIQQLRVRGIQISAETTPHYLQLSKDKLSGPDASLFVMTPPLRTVEDNAALWGALEQGSVAIVATDHCTFTREQKLSSQDCRTIYPGIPGTEEMLPLIHTFGVRANRFSIERMISLLSVNPAKTFGIYPQKGSLSEGTDADIMIFDPDISWTISSDSVHTAAGYSPYEGTKVHGKAVLTIRRGEILVEGDEYRGTPGSGSFVPAGRPGVYAKEH